MTARAVAREVADGCDPAPRYAFDVQFAEPDGSPLAVRQAKLSLDEVCELEGLLARAHGLVVRIVPGVGPGSDDGLLPVLLAEIGG